MLAVAGRFAVLAVAGRFAVLAVAFVGGRAPFRPPAVGAEYEKDSRSCPAAAAPARAPTEPVDIGGR